MNLNMNSNILPENNTKVNIRHCILDPISVIIKLAILSNKPIGTKLLISSVFFPQQQAQQETIALIDVKANIM